MSNTPESKESVPTLAERLYNVQRGAHARNSVLGDPSVYAQILEFEDFANIQPPINPNAELQNIFNSRLEKAAKKARKKRTEKILKQTKLQDDLRTEKLGIKKPPPPPPPGFGFGMPVIR